MAGLAVITDSTTNTHNLAGIFIYFWFNYKLGTFDGNCNRMVDFEKIVMKHEGDNLNRYYYPLDFQTMAGMVTTYIGFYTYIKVGSPITKQRTYLH